MWRIKNKERDRNRDVLRKYKIISRIINKSKYTSPKYLLLWDGESIGKLKRRIILRRRDGVQSIPNRQLERCYR
jgi:hypothetical protein